MAGGTLCQMMKNLRKIHLCGRMVYVKIGIPWNIVTIYDEKVACR